MLVLLVLVTVLSVTTPLFAQPPNLPILDPTTLGYEETEYYYVANLYSVDQLHSAVHDGVDGKLTVDLTSISQLLDGTQIDPDSLYGHLQFGPYPFEAAETDFAYKRFRKGARIREGKAEINVESLTRERSNSEGWVDTGQIMLRFDLRLAKSGIDRNLGLYDIVIRFHVGEEVTRKLPVLVEGPMVNRLTSDDPTQCVVTFITDRPGTGTVRLNDETEFSSPQETRFHEILISDLVPTTSYEYEILFEGEPISRKEPFTTAPPKGCGPVRFAYMGDTREGYGSGDSGFMGVNYRTLERLSAIAMTEDASFFIVGGDLINGYTSVPDDFSTQLHAWKQALSGFWRRHAVYPGIGNHDALIRVFRLPGEKERLEIDRWPYETVSSEALFARAFANPENGPTPSDPRRPTYKENVFSFHYGFVKVIAFNNNYWVATHPEVTGGVPEGYILSEQIDWISKELDEAESDPLVKYVVLYCQEPVFPCGGHLGDAMWYRGDNKTRASTVPSGSTELVPEELGLIEVRNRLVRRIGACSKVAAVFSADEHSYYRVLIDSEVPVGDPSADDTDGDGQVCEEGEPCSPLSDLAHPTWYITSGGGGAAYYSEEPAPWTEHWGQTPLGPDTAPGSGKFVYSSQENMLILDASMSKISMTVRNPHGEVIDSMEDLMEVKRK